MLMLYIFPAAVLCAFLGIVADAVVYRAPGRVRSGILLIFCALAASYALALVLLSLAPFYEDNNSVSLPGWPEILFWALEFAGWMALVIVPAAFGFLFLFRRWRARQAGNGEASVRLMGQGHDAAVFDVGGRLFYAQLVGFGPADVEFRFPIRRDDLSILLADPWRRAVLQVTSNRILQYSAMPGRRALTAAGFRKLVRTVLHATPKTLDTFIARVSHDYNVDVMTKASETRARWAAPERVGP